MVVTGDFQLQQDSSSGNHGYLNSAQISVLLLLQVIGQRHIKPLLEFFTIVSLTWFGFAFFHMDMDIRESMLTILNNLLSQSDINVV